MKSLDEDKSISVATNKDRGFLPNLQHALGDLADSLRPECGPSFQRDIDFGDWMGLTCSAVILTTITLRNVGDMKMRRAICMLRPAHLDFPSDCDGDLPPAGSRSTTVHPSDAAVRMARQFLRRQPFRETAQCGHGALSEGPLGAYLVVLGAVLVFAAAVWAPHRAIGSKGSRGQ
jgi:hypothetical protein